VEEESKIKDAQLSRQQEMEEEVVALALGRFLATHIIAQLTASLELGQHGARAPKSVLEVSKDERDNATIQLHNMEAVTAQANQQRHRVATRDTVLM
jgi:hypothetical protein